MPRLHTRTLSQRMDRLDLLESEYDRVHREMSALVAELSDAQIRCIPLDGLTSVAWLAWHVTRIEDLVVNRFVAHCSQAFHEHAWGERLGITDSAVGLSANAAHVHALSTAIDLPMLLAYRTAVESRTRSVLLELRPIDLDEIVDAAYIDWLLRADGAVQDRAHLRLNDWESGTKAAYFSRLAVAHQWQHYGEALMIRKLCFLTAGGANERG
jgi:hypothetical protein